MTSFIFESGNLVKHNSLSFHTEASTAVYTMCRLIIDSVYFQDKNELLCNITDELFKLFQTDCDYNIDINDFELDLINNDVKVTFDSVIDALERRSGIANYLYQYNDYDIDYESMKKVKIFKKIEEMKEEFNELDYIFSSFNGGMQLMNIKSKINTIIDDERRLKAYATVTLDNQFVIKGIKVIETKNNGLLVAMPQIKNSQGKYQDICYPNNSEFRNAISESVIGEYIAELEIRNEQNQSDEIEESSDSFEQSM